MKSIEARARKKIREATGHAMADRLEQLLNDLEVANDLSRVPMETLAEKPAKYRKQVMERVGHWTEKADIAHRKLSKALGDKGCETKGDF